jgi:hypothetical protein
MVVGSLICWEGLRYSRTPWETRAFMEESLIVNHYKIDQTGEPEGVCFVIQTDKINVVHTARRYYRLNGLVRPPDRRH